MVNPYNKCKFCKTPLEKQDSTFGPVTDDRLAHDSIWKCPQCGAKMVWQREIETISETRWYDNARIEEADEDWAKLKARLSP